MLRISLAVAAAIAAAGCAMEPEVDDCQCALGEVCSDEGVCRATDSKFDLPNGAVVEGPHDGAGYAAIADAFGAQGLALPTDTSLLDLVWPTTVGETAALNRFGTPIQLGGIGYFHTALDVMRPSLAVSHDVVAPVAGTALVFDWFGTPGYNGNPYSTVVGIWDPQSHVIAQLMHVLPSPELIAAGMTPLEVTRGQVIGSLAPVPLDTPELQEAFKHTHVNLVDGDKRIALDPSRWLPYRDSIAPVVGEVYVLDSGAQRSAALLTGPLDVVVELSDRDDFSARNFEIAALAYNLAIDGAVVASSERCNLEDLIERVGDPYETHALKLLDFGNARHQIGVGGWPQSDIDNKARTFRYALTQLAVVDGTCTVRPDAEGFIDVPDGARTLKVTVTAWDRNENFATVERIVAR